MTIVSSKVVEDGPEQAKTGVKYLRFEFMDHTGKAYTHFGYGKYPVDVDVQKKKGALTRDLAKALDLSEKKSAWLSDDPLSFVLSPIHSTTEKVARYVVRQLMLTTDLSEIEKAKPFVDHITKMTNADAAKMLNITIAQLVVLKTKVAKVFVTKYTDMTYKEVEDFIGSSLEVKEWG